MMLASTDVSYKSHEHKPRGGKGHEAIRDTGRMDGSREQDQRL